MILVSFPLPDHVMLRHLARSLWHEYAQETQTYPHIVIPPRQEQEQEQEQEIEIEKFADLGLQNSPWNGARNYEF